MGADQSTAAFDDDEPKKRVVQIGKLLGLSNGAYASQEVVASLDSALGVLGADKSFGATLIKDLSEESRSSPRPGGGEQPPRTIAYMLEHAAAAVAQREYEQYAEDNGLDLRVARLADGWNLALHTDVLHDAVFEEDGFLYVSTRTPQQRHADFIVALAVYLHTSGPAAIFATYGWPGSHLKKHGSHYQKAWKLLMLIWDAQSPLAKQLKAVLLTEEWPKAENGVTPQWPFELPCCNSEEGILGTVHYKQWLNRAASLSTAMASPWLISLCCGKWRHVVLKHLPQVKKAEEWRDASFDWKALSDDEIVRRGGEPAFLKALWKAQPDDANARQVCCEVARASHGNDHHNTGRKGDKGTTRESFGATLVQHTNGAVHVVVGGNKHAVVSFPGVTEQSWDLARTACCALNSGVLAARVLSIAHAEVLPKVATSLTALGFGKAGALLSMFDADKSLRQADIEVACSMLRWDCRKPPSLSFAQLCVYHVHLLDVLFGYDQPGEVGGASHAASVAERRITASGYNNERAAVLIGWCRWHAAHREWLEDNVRWPLWRTYVEAANRAVLAQSGKAWFETAVRSVPPFKLPELPSEEELEERKREDAEKKKERYASSPEARMWDEMLRLYEEKGRGFGQLGVQAELKRRGFGLDQSCVSKNLKKARKRRDEVLPRSPAASAASSSGQSSSLTGQKRRAPEEAEAEAEEQGEEQKEEQAEKMASASWAAWLGW